MTVKFRGLIAPTETPTGDGRIFQAGKMTHRDLPMPMMFRATSGGHDNAPVVGKINRIYDGPGGYWCEGEFLDPQQVPEAKKAIYMVQQKVVGPSVDLDRDFTVNAVSHPSRPDKKAGLFSEYNVIGVTLVPMPAFKETHLSVDSQEEQALMASIGLEVEVGYDLPQMATFDINPGHWKNWPLAPREYTFDADDAVKRIAAWSGIGSRAPALDKYSSAFLWRRGDQAGPTLAQDSFRLPLGDVINGELHLIYHAVYAAAALLSGAHGGLPNIPDHEKQAMVGPINEMYNRMAQEYGDSSMKSPFEQGRGQQASIDCGCDEEFAAKEPYGDVTYADPGYQADKKKRYPIDTAEHVRAAWSYINQGDNASAYSAEQLASIENKIKSAAKKLGVEIADSMTAGSFQPSHYFADPGLKEPTPLTVTEDGRVFGHLATWKVCHVGIGDSCVLAPKSKTDYSLFRNGQTVSFAGGQARRMGKITLGTGHANPRYGVVPARDHYDNSGWAAADVNVGEDKYGIWVAGKLVDGITPQRVAELRRSPLSGDWRMYNGNLELVAALAVNSPGFPVYREEEGSAFSLVAVGIVEQGEEEIVDAEFSLEVPADDNMSDADELALRLERWAAINEERQFLLQKQRGQQLADIKDERAKVAEQYAQSEVAIQQNAKFVHLAE
jgi:hypothetical protein